MGDIFKNLTGGWNFLVSWVFPSAIAWVIFGFFAFPRLRQEIIFKEVASTSVATQTLVLVGASIFTGILLSGFSTILFRIIEGYYLDHYLSGLASRMRKHQRARRDRLSDELESLTALREQAGNADDGSRDSSQLGLAVRIGLLEERLERYPAALDQIGPTQFANALRAVETYGWDRYRLDSQCFWSELVSVVPDSLRSEEKAARTPMNFAMSMMYLAGLAGTACITVGLLTPGPITPVVVGILAISAVPAWYKLAVLNTRDESSVVQAIVNVGRKELAAKLGFALPGKLVDERRMWEHLRWFVTEDFDEKYIDDLDVYRLAPEDYTGPSGDTQDEADAKPPLPVTGCLLPEMLQMMAARRIKQEATAPSDDGTEKLAHTKPFTQR